MRHAFPSHHAPPAIAGFVAAFAGALIWSAMSGHPVPEAAIPKQQPAAGVAPSACDGQTWPYVSPECVSGPHGARTVRMISTGRAPIEDIAASQPAASANPAIAAHEPAPADFSGRWFDGSSAVLSVALETWHAASASR